ncbi:hypothetical protein D2V17_09130 [Aurantiacibacter xanthus]|uniref:Conjugal transfer protein TrbK n=1 Tax=Aurantiacibacter xanthus TaxID=1784712 RepID=A0A3A1P4A9_9SPHN|nr:putative entry exclusion protein TrbK-alt [Aurantiacibacter xanthus]RIV87041.1 hypothetical protein D2V17_09130 [Aurantiacibacter xanthus]|tara:strand:+ start:30467 stop:30727 length:261 start_codon:yes stop_codon:yes gene_type:complete
MSRTARISGVAAIAGIMLAVAIVALSEPDDLPREAVLPVVEESEPQEMLARELERCATLIMPDTACEQAWAEKRRRFFGSDEGERR